MKNQKSYSSRGNYVPSQHATFPDETRRCVYLVYSSAARLLFELETRGSKEVAKKEAGFLHLVTVIAKRRDYFASL